MVEIDKTISEFMPFKRQFIPGFESMGRMVLVHTDRHS